MDQIIGTGVAATVQDFVAEAFESAGLNFRDHVEFDERYLRPTEVAELTAEPSQAIASLNLSGLMNWRNIAKLMVEEDMKRSKDPKHIDIPKSPLWDAESTTQ